MFSSRLTSPRSLIRSLTLRTRAGRLCISRPVLAALPLAIAVPVLAAPAKLTGVQAWTSGAQTYIRVRPDASTPIVAKVVKHTPLYVWGKYDGWYRVQTHDDIFGWVHYELLNSSGLGKVEELSSAAVERGAQRSANITMWGTPEQLKAYYNKYGAKGAAKGLIEMGVPITTKRQPRTIKAKAKSSPRRVAPRKVATVKPRVRPRVVTSSMARRVAVKAPVVQQIAPDVNVATAPVAVATASPVRVLPPAPPKTVARTTTARTTTTSSAAKPARRLTAKERKRQQLRAKMGMTAKTPPPAINQIPPVSPEDLMKARRTYLDARKKKLEGAPEVNPETGGEDLGGAQITPSNFERDADNTLDRNGWAPFNTSGWGGSTRSSFGFADWKVQNVPAFRLVTEEAEAATLDADEVLGDKGLDDEELRRWNSLPALDSLETKIVANAKKKPLATPLRGGSPRDRYRNAKGDFRKDFANQALSYRGMPYVFGSASPSRGFDCSGLIYYLLRKRGYNPPRTAAGYRNYGTAVARKDLKVGDLLLFANTYKRGISHIGIYIGNNNFVHAASTRQGVRTDSLATAYFAKKYYSARRVPQR